MNILQTRQILYGAATSRDPSDLESLMTLNDLKVNTSRVYGDNVLLFMVKQGCLEMVEYLLSVKHYKEHMLEVTNRQGMTSLDTAVVRLLETPEALDPVSARGVANLCRILKSLLQSGASVLSTNHITATISKLVAQSEEERQCSGQCVDVRLAKIVQNICRYGEKQIMTRMLKTLILSNRRLDLIHSLLVSGANPVQVMTDEPIIVDIDINTALLLVQACNQSALLSAIQCACLGTASEGMYTDEQLLLLQLLTLSAINLPLHVMITLRQFHHSTYMWCTRYRTTPSPLSHLCRLSTRRSMSNVLYAVNHVNLPYVLRDMLLFLDHR